MPRIEVRRKRFREFSPQAGPWERVGNPRSEMVGGFLLTGGSTCVYGVYQEPRWPNNLRERMMTETRCDGDFYAVCDHGSGVVCDQHAAEQVAYWQGQFFPVTSMQYTADDLVNAYDGYKGREW